MKKSILVVQTFFFTFFSLFRSLGSQERDWGKEGHTPEAGNSVAPFTSCVTFDKIFKDSKSQFPLL